MHGEEWNGTVKKNQTLNSYKAKKAVHVLLSRPEKIRNVQDWAHNACISEDWLRKILRKKYSKSPKQIIREVRFETIVSLIAEDGWEATADSVAIDCGVGKNSKALHKFLKRDYDTTFTQLRQKVFTGKRVVKFIWTDGVNH